MLWDVIGGVARRSWARNPNAMAVSRDFNKDYAGAGHVTMPFIPDENLIKTTIAQALKDE